MRDTAPSVEFSTGAMPNADAPASTERNTSSIDGQGSPSIDWPKYSNIACSLYVPTGPRNATWIVCSSARLAAMISRQMALMCSLASGPALMSCSRAITCSSRSGRNTGALKCFLTSPTSSATAARWFRSAISCASIASMRSRSGFRREFSSSSMRFAVLFEQRRRQAPRCSKSFMYSTSAFTPSSGTAL